MSTNYWQRKSALVVFILLIMVYVAFPSISSFTSDPFFYVNHLPAFYWVTTMVIGTLIILLVMRRRPEDKVLLLTLVLVAVVLVEWTPNILIENPWHVEEYGRAARAQFLGEVGSKDLAGEEAESPAFLTYGAAFMLLTNVHPFLFAKIHELLVIMLISLFLVMISRSLGAEYPYYTLAPIAFYAVMWMNEFHFSRQSLLALSYPVFLYLVFKVLKQRNVATALLNVLIIPWLVMSHPATIPITYSAVFLLSLVVLVEAKLHPAVDKESNAKKSMSLCILPLIVWFIWHAQLFWEKSGVIETLTKIVMRVYDSLMIKREYIVAMEYEKRIFAPAYELIVNTRLALVGVVAFTTFIMVLLYVVQMVRGDGDKKGLFSHQFASSFCIANLVITGIFLYGGHVIVRGFLFLSMSWAVSLTLTLNGMGKKRAFFRGLFRGKRRITCLLLMVTSILVISLLFFIPVLKFSPIPFISPSKRELSMLSFVYEHSMNDTNYFVTEFNVPHPSISSISFYEMDPDRSTNLDNLANMTSGVIIDGRLTLRDGFYLYHVGEGQKVPSYKEWLDALTARLSDESNKVYCASQYYEVYASI